MAYELAEPNEIVYSVDRQFGTVQNLHIPQHVIIAEQDRTDYEFKQWFNNMAKGN